MKKKIELDTRLLLTKMSKRKSRLAYMENIKKQKQQMTWHKDFGMRMLPSFIQIDQFNNKFLMKQN